MKPIVFLIYNNVIILITLVAMFNSYYFALLSVLLILGEGRLITANSDIYIYIYIKSLNTCTFKDSIKYYLY